MIVFKSKTSLRNKLSSKNFVLNFSASELNCEKDFYGNMCGYADKNDVKALAPVGFFRFRDIFDDISHMLSDPVFLDEPEPFE